MRNRSRLFLAILILDILRVLGALCAFKSFSRGLGLRRTTEGTDKLVGMARLPRDQFRCIAAGPLTRTYAARESCLRKVDAVGPLCVTFRHKRSRRPFSRICVLFVRTCMHSIRL